MPGDSLDWGICRVARKLVSEAELLRILTERMQQLPNGKNGTIGRIFHLPRPDDHGCNWIPDLASASSPSALYLVLPRARDEFNLVDE